MLFWIFVFLLTRQSGLTQGHPDLLSRAATEASCDCTINSCRTLFDIVWGCLATIFACTWVALHQNVPDPDLGHFALLMRKLRMMLVTIAPEVIVGFAARQFLSAREISKGKVPYHSIKKIKKADIDDKSKGDTLSKGIAIAQGLWFVTQCLARAFQHLPLTELEVATLAFAVLSVAIRLLWLDKPLDVQQPIVVTRSEVDIDPLQEEDITPMNNGSRTLFHSLLDKLGSAMAGDYAHYHPISSTSVPSFYSIEKDVKYTNKLEDLKIAGVFGVGSIFGGIHCAAWNALFPSMAEMWIWRISSVFIAAYPALTTLLIIGDLYDGIATAFLMSFVVVGAMVYPIFRLFLIILSFTTLRSLPPSAFVDVNWSNYIPHL
ncbi:hypothetical protein B0H16DRAFT_1690884 [Mycena metata]|uniref:Uncharacterized protein n=1 Tax=Mycena metata TaxID=1033252 RepID=A0AAD7IY76_9AGAR|nr:hypothetical protein B0H16DRAFT_1690884 [Mycena metata]